VHQLSRQSGGSRPLTPQVQGKERAAAVRGRIFSSAEQRKMQAAGSFPLAMMQDYDFGILQTFKKGRHNE
jgi:hypothetical protein